MQYTVKIKHTVPEPENAFSLVKKTFKINNNKNIIMIKKNKWIKLNIHIPCFAKGLMYCLFKIYLSIKTSK